MDHMKSTAAVLVSEAEGAPEKPERAIVSPWP